MKFTKLLVAAGIALSALGAQAQNLVTNGSFETQTNLAGSDLSRTNLDVRGWDIFPTLAGWQGVSDIELRKTGVAGNASEGNYFVELDTTANRSMWQDITASGVVTLTFDFMARIKTGATNGLSYSFGDVGAPVVSVLNNASGGINPNAWSTFTDTFNFGSTTSTKRLTFYSTSVSDSYGASLDNVSVTAVPEVETYAMMLAGLGLMGSIARRRKAKNA
jgi:hypothetical protein